MNKRLTVLLLSMSLILYCLHLPLVKASGSMTWGTPMTIQQHILIGSNEEVRKGQYAYVFNQQQQPEDTITKDQWEAFMRGDLSSLAHDIENKLSGSKVVWIQIAWEKAETRPITQWPYNLNVYVVSGVRVEAIVKNLNAGMTGAEIVLIIMACAFIIAVVALLAMAAWVIWRVISASEQLGPVATIGVGLLILIAVLFAILMIFGIRFAYTGGKKPSFRMGKNAFFFWRALR